MSYEGKSGGGGGGGGEGKSPEGGSSSHSTTATTSSADRKSRNTKNSMVARLTVKLFKERGRHCFQEWFTPREVMRFKDNPDMTQLEPLYQRYMDKMEAALADFAADEGLRGAHDIFKALEECRERDSNEYRRIDRMIDVMAKKEEFFIMMQKNAEKNALKGIGVDDDDDSHGASQQFSGK